MKKISFALVVMISSIFVACNKEEDITIDNPDDYPPGHPEYILEYSVIDYTPAPGQFINENISGFNDIFNMEQACKQTEKRLQTQSYVSLGAWGGNITVKLKKPIINNPEFNFAIAGNSFDTSNEPGIVWVMQDSNHNGLPDDTWYELKGSYYDLPGYERNYSVTYFRPGPGEDTRWTDSNGNEGYVKWLGSYHNQDFYYPNWILSDSYTLHGSRLPSLAEKNQDTGIWSNPPFEWGYVDNHGEDVITVNVNGKSIKANAFKISNAIDKDGKEIKLEAIDFIKVQTAINSDTNILGENSTEICGLFVL